MPLTKNQWDLLRQSSIRTSRMLGETDSDADDNAQEVFLKLTKIDLTTVNDTEKYAKSITRNIIRDKYRHRKKRPELLINQEAIERLGESCSQHNSVIQSDYESVISELSLFISKETMHRELFDFIFEKYILHQPALEFAAKIALVQRNADDQSGDKMSEWKIPESLRTSFRAFKNFLRTNNLNMQQILDILNQPEHVVSNANLQPIAAELCEKYISNIISNIQKHRIGSILQANAGTHNFKVNMQQSFWQISQMISELSMIDQRYYTLGALQYIRSNLRRAGKAKHFSSVYLEDAWCSVSSCFKYDLFHNNAEEWIGVELLGLLPEFSQISIDQFDQQMTSVIKRVKNKQSLPKLGAAWVCSNLRKLPMFQPVANNFFRHIDISSWPGGEAAYPMIAVTPYLSVGFSAKRESLHNENIWESIVRALNSSSDVAKIGAIFVLTYIPPEFCPSGIRKSLEKIIMELSIKSNPFIQMTVATIKGSYIY